MHVTLNNRDKPGRNSVERALNAKLDAEGDGANVTLQCSLERIHTGVGIAIEVTIKRVQWRSIGYKVCVPPVYSII